MNEKITLSGVPETMLQTLYARAKETCTRGAIRDEKGNMENYKYYNDNNFVSSYRVSKFVVDWMRERGDMRLPKLAEMMIKLDGKNADPTDLANYKGVIPNPGATGDNNNTDMEDGSQSRLKSKWYLEPVGPSAMNIGYPEQEFILAEAALRGWTDDDPETHYLNGIRAAHEFLGVSSADTRHQANLITQLILENNL